MALVAPPKSKPTAGTTTSSASGSGSGGAKRLTARQKARMRLENPLIPRKVHRAEAVVSDSFINSKKDKRIIKHSSFVSRISKSHPSSSSKQLKRRRPSKKLVTTLESLGDALDDIAAEAKEGGNGMMDASQALQGKIRHKSLKSRPGALKRKEKVVKGEMERFGRSLAQLASVRPSTTASEQQQTQVQPHAEVMETEEKPIVGAAVAQSATSNRWAALRGFISATMEQNPAFLQQQK